jgi:hypothetical protein
MPNQNRDLGHMSEREYDRSQWPKWETVAFINVQASALIVLIFDPNGPAAQQVPFVFRSVARLRHANREVKNLLRSGAHHQVG